MSVPVRVVVVDDHPTFRIGMTALLEEMTDVEVVGEAATEDDAVELVLRVAPDVVVMDLDLAGGSGAAATGAIKRQLPEVAVLVMTMHGEDEPLFQAVRAGATGYVLKGASPEEIERALRAVANGELLLGPQVAQRALGFLTNARNARGGAFTELTDRELEVLELVAQGHDNTTIARMLFLTNKTVRNYVYAIFGKLGVNDRAGLVARARDAGLGGAE